MQGSRATHPPGTTGTRRAPRPPRLARSLFVTLATSAMLATALVASASPPEVDDAVETFDHTKNLKPMGFSERVPEGDGLGDVNSDLAFWGDHAFQGSFNGFRIIDVSSPRHFEEVAEVHDTCMGGQGDVVVYEDVLVRSWDGSTNPGGECAGMEAVTGLQVFDISDLENPVGVTAVDLDCGSHTSSAVPDPDNDRLLVYASPHHGGCDGIEIVEVPLDSPEDAELVNFADAGQRCHDTAVILGDAMLAACAGHDYMTGGALDPDATGVVVWSMHPDDGGSLEEPAFLYQAMTPGVGIGHSAAFTWDGEIIAFGHEPGGGVAPRCREADAPENHTIYFMEARSGDLAGEWELPRKQGDTENCTIHNYNIVPTDKAYVLVGGHYQAGINAIDFSDPENAYEFAYADPEPFDEDRLITAGSWSAYWYNGTIYDTDIRRGLISWNLNDPRVAGAEKLTHLNKQTQEFTIEPGPAFGRVAQGSQGQAGPGQQGR